MAKINRKRRPKIILRLPDLEQAKSAVLNSLPSPSSQRSYDHAIREFIEWYCSEPRLAFNKTVVTRYRICLEQAQYASSTINLRLAAVRRLAYEAADPGLLSSDLAAGIRPVKGAKNTVSGSEIGSRLTKGNGCFRFSIARVCEVSVTMPWLPSCWVGLRRAELAGVAVQDLQQREEHWVFADLLGKGGHIRTVPIPSWIEVALQTWMSQAKITAGPIFRAINKAGRVATQGFSPKVIWAVVKEACARCGLAGVVPHDLRRTCARLCHEAGGDLEQIQFLLGHVSVRSRTLSLLRVCKAWRP